MTKELEESRKQLKLRDQEILQLRAQVQLAQGAPALQPHSPVTVPFGPSIMSQNRTIYNIIRWFGGSLGQMSRRPSV